MKLFLLSFLLPFTLLTGNAQTKYPLTFNMKVAYGQSHFQSNEKNTPKLSTSETRLGLEVQKPLNPIFSFVTGFAFGVKGQVEYGKYFQPIMTLATIVLQRITYRNHFFVETPLLIQYHLPNTPFRFRAGGNFRVFLNEKYNPGSSSFQRNVDMGLIGGVNANLSKKVNLGFEYCHGISKVIDETFVVSSTSTYHLYARNIFFQLNLSYQF